MKIVIFVEQFNPDKGYLEYYLARELTKLGHKIYVFTFGKNGAISRIRMREGFEVINLPYLTSLNGDYIPTLSGIAYIIQFVGKEKPEIVHCQPLCSILSMVFISTRHFFGYEILGSLYTQTPSLDRISRRLLFYFVRLLVRFYIKNRSEKIFVKSNELMKIQEQLFGTPRHKFCIIPLGADEILFKFNSKARMILRKKLNLSETDIVIVYSGKINRSKDIDVLIKAVAPIITQNRKVKLLIIGSGEPPYIEYLRHLISSFKILNNVIFHSWVHRTSLPAFYSASDIAVWPGMSSISIIEAASTGLPLIIARSPVEIYGVRYGNGFVFKRGSINELHKYLETLIYNEKLRKEMGHKSRQLVERRLNWRSIALQYVDVYKHTLRL